MARVATIRDMRVNQKCKVFFETIHYAKSKVYGLAVRQNKGNQVRMKQVIMASLFKVIRSHNRTSVRKVKICGVVIVNPGQKALNTNTWVNDYLMTLSR